jgi:hypothetical protein
VHNTFSFQPIIVDPVSLFSSRQTYCPIVTDLLPDGPVFVRSGRHSMSLRQLFLVCENEKRQSSAALATASGLRAGVAILRCFPQTAYFAALTGVLDR